MKILWLISVCLLFEVGRSFPRSQLRVANHAPHIVISYADHPEVKRFKKELEESVELSRRIKEFNERVIEVEKRQNARKKEGFFESLFNAIGRFISSGTIKRNEAANKQAEVVDMLSGAAVKGDEIAKQQLRRFGTGRKRTPGTEAPLSFF
ncbi:hypothetical protein QR680_007018 [Steinernema hermaphroditum]|uniref:SXP/RAL-2 family protein Ani s 5-like cation-binding domain-containing protein n=1 Tax=Steinernema hermaphroditum TaxID=289476 RepID=A0AA39HYY1_9BILA|nr:hypothetical protein QR680_007018 [Steinernema hermaphroditum]